MIEKIDSTTQEKLRQTVDKIEKLEEDKKGLGQDIREVYAEAKAFGFDTKALRQLIKIRKTARIEREEQEAILETYLIALGEI